MGRCEEFVKGRIVCKMMGSDRGGAFGHARKIRWGNEDGRGFGISLHFDGEKTGCVYEHILVGWLLAKIFTKGDTKADRHRMPHKLTKSKLLCHHEVINPSPSRMSSIHAQIRGRHERAGR